MAPIPNREDDLARPRSRQGDKGRGTQTEVTKGNSRPAYAYEPDPSWHDSAKRLWLAATMSGQQDFYEQSDWAMLHTLCDDLSYYKSQGRRSAQMAATIYSALGTLLLTEGERRRARIELTDPEPEQASAAVLAIAEYREQLGVPEDEEDGE